MVGADGAGLSCPGSSVVAESSQNNSELSRLIKIPADTLPEHTQDNGSLLISEDEE